MCRLPAAWELIKWADQTPSDFKGNCGNRHSFKTLSMCCRLTLIT